MNRTYRLFAPVLACALLLGGCREDDGLIGRDDVEHLPALNPDTFSPLTNETGTVAAYIGTEVTVEGFNLDLTGSVTLDDVSAEITMQTIKTLKFRIPALDYEQRDRPYDAAFRIMDRDGAVFYECTYFVTVPVTDAIVEGYEPREGTVGTEVTISGRNLEQLTRVHFGDAVVEAVDFLEVQEGSTGSYVKFAVPAGGYTAADSEQAITAEWGTQTVDVTGEEPFLLHIPVVDPLAAQPGDTASVLGDELLLTGANLDLVTGVKWGDAALTITEQSAGALTVKFPMTMAQTDPAVQSRPLTAEYGPAAQTIEVAAAWRLDTTPSAEVLVPVARSMTAEDGGAGNRFYLAKTVTVAGENLTVVEGIELFCDGVSTEATLLEGATDGTLQFIVPEEVAFDEASEVEVRARHNGGEIADFGRATVCPFYFWPDVVIGGQDKTNREIAFFVPDWGRCVSTDEWAQLDKYASETVMSDKNVLNKSEVTKEQYYEVPGYFFCTAGSSLSLLGPCGSDSQLSKFTTSGGDKIIAKGYGTPVFGLRNLSAGTTAEEAAAVAAVKEGSIATMTFTKTKVASSSPKYDGKGEASNTFTEDQVLLIQHVTYDKGALNPAPGEIHRGGFIHIRKIENPTENTARITFDCYWSKPMND